MLLLDLHMPDMNGPEVAEAIKKSRPEQKIIMLTHQKGSRYLGKLEKLRINGYVLKNTKRAFNGLLHHSHPVIKSFPKNLSGFPACFFY
jgi:DNA-binding NarL/FixJ family response regulator